jgi:predicted aldo/keto reductase-like oxidoreductase
MLRIKTYLAPTKKGIGLFAAEPVRKGTIIYRFDHGIEPIFKSLANIPHESKDFMEKFCYSRNNEFRLPLDNKRFIQHAEPANCFDNGERCITLINIEPKTELTCNFKDLGLTDQDIKFNYLHT